MKHFSKILGILLLCLCGFSLTITVEAAQLQENTAPTENLMTFEDGDIIGFIGDSITHARYCDINYLEILNQYYLCQFPERKVEFRNLGVAGYKACDILDIYDIDPGFQGINKAVIMLGTNEAILKYSPEKYIGDMDKLISNLKADGLAGEDILLLTPPFCDEQKASSSLFKIENTLLKYMEALETKVPEWGVQYLDIHTPMAELTEEIRKENPENMLTTDGIHPNTTGQAFIAYSLLQAQDAGNVIQLLEEGAESQSETTAFYRAQKGMFGSFLQETLPWAATEELQDFLKFYEPAGSLYQELLQVDGFSEDTFYQVFVNETGLGTFTGRELAEGINLANLMSHPFQPQVQQLAELNRQWHKTTVRYRDIWIDVMMKRVTYTKGQAQTKYDNWRKKEEALRAEMSALAQGSINNTCFLYIVEAGYPVAQLEADYLAELERARKEEEKQAQQKLQAQKEAEALAQREALAQKEAEETARREAAQKVLEQAEKEAAQTALLELCLMGLIIAAIAAALSLPFILRQNKKDSDRS